MKHCIPNGRYQHYLESVLEGADEFHEVGDLMLRHATLAATNQDLKEQRNHFGEAAEQTRSALHTCRLSSISCMHMANICACVQLPACHNTVSIAPASHVQGCS